MFLARVSSLIPLLLFFLHSAAALWPRPSIMTHGRPGSPLRIDPARLAFTAATPHLFDQLPADLKNAIKRTRARLANESMLPLSVDYGASRAGSVEQAALLGEVIIDLRSSTHTPAPKPSHQQIFGVSPSLPKGVVQEIQQDVAHLDEAYTLFVPLTGAAILSANSSLGILRGLTTLEQLVYALPSAAKGAAPGAKYIWDTPIHIEDRPAFPYRGLMLDTSRNFISIAALERTIDAMALAKLNQLHWHITDAQSFPLKLPGRLALLAKAGAYSADETYEPEEVKRLVQYAGERGININVELDMPGHQLQGPNALEEELIVCTGKAEWDRWANEPPSGHLALNSSVVDAFVTELITETAKLFAGPYFGTGNDEVNSNCYNATTNEEIDEDLLMPFVRNAHAAVTAAGKTPMVWEEAAIAFPRTGASLLPGTLVEAWTSTENVAKILKSNPGVRLIHAPVQRAYLDVGHGDWLGNSTKGSWSEFVSWQRAYDFDPYNGTQGIEGGRERVVGGETALWGEQADEHVMDSYIWPRAASAAEVYWTGASYGDDDGEHTRSLVDALPRLHDLRFRLVGRGVQAMPLQPKYCALRPDRCLASTK